MKRPLVVALTVLTAAVAAAKLPPPDDAAQAKAAEAEAKKAHDDKVAAYKLCRTMDKVAAEYYAEAKKEGKAIKPPQSTAACVDPGPLMAKPHESRPSVEFSGAHSPARPATNPPSTPVPHAEDPAAKK